MSTTPKTDAFLAAYHLQCARWDLSMLIDEHHDRHACDSEDASCEALHDIQRDISYALEALGEKLCETPIRDSQEYRPAGYVKTRKPYRVHAARLVLAEQGFTVSAVADHAGVYPSTVTRQLAGERALGDPVRVALVELVGDDGAELVIEAIPTRSGQEAS